MEACRRRLGERTLAKARSFVTLPFDEPVAEVLARLLAGAKKLSRRAPLADAIIAATALVHDLTVWTQDEDFDVLADTRARAPRSRVGWSYPGATTTQWFRAREKPT